MPLRLALLALLCASPAGADPWLGGPDVDDDAIAEGPGESSDPGEESAEPDEVIDLQVFAGSFEDAARRVVADGVDPVQALPVDLTAVPEVTSAELKGLLAGSGATSARLHAVEVRLVLWNGSTAVHAIEATLLPGARTALLGLGAVTPPMSERATALPGGLGRTWKALERQLATVVREGRCRALPVVPDPVLKTVVPPAYLEAARTARDKAAAARGPLCAKASSATWDRAELRLESLHFNLFDAAGALRGGLRLQVDPETGAFTYPMFKKLGK